MDMSVWENYSDKQRKEYINYIRMYGELSRMFNQKSSNTGAPYLDSKFQETVYSRSFNAEAVDIGNTPHDMKSIISGKNIGIGIKTWLNSKPSYQKVMQLKSFKDEINAVKDDSEKLANKLAEIKNHKLEIDYNRLGLTEDENIYHYITRDRGNVVIQETAYPLIDIKSLRPVNRLSKSSKSFEFEDDFKKYKYTFGDSQIWMMFGESNDHTLIDKIKISIMDDPFDFLKKAFDAKRTGEIIVPKLENSYVDDKADAVYLPLYSYRHKGELPSKSGLNAWNGASKSKNSNKARPEAEVYIPIPREFWKKEPKWFNPNIDFTDYISYKKDTGKRSYTFNLHLPDGTVYPALVGQSGFKALETSPQNALGKWLLYKVLGLSRGTILTNDTFRRAGFDSVKIWHRNSDDYKNVWIDFAPVGTFEKFMNNQMNVTEDEFNNI